MHIVLFILALIIFSVYLSQKKNLQKQAPIPPPRLADWQVATSQTVDWQELFIDRCESPAEAAFLNAIILAYQLVPENGALKGGGLELQLQMPIGHYRADFLANMHLVVEIDGAAYHSSPEAIEKDRIRDEFIVQSGYVVLRIPAKLVFNSPNEAVQRVRTAISNLAHERSIRAQEVARSATVPKPAPTRTFFSGLGKALNDASELMDRTLVLQKAKEAFIQASFPEVHMIDCAMKLGTSRMEIAAWIRNNPSSAEIYLESLKQLRAAPGLTESSYSPMTISPFRLPEIDSDPKYRTSIKEMYDALLEERSEHLNDIRKALEKDSELAKYVEEALKHFVQNSDDLWRLIHATDTRNTGNLAGTILSKNDITARALDEICEPIYVKVKDKELASHRISHPNI